MNWPIRLIMGCAVMLLGDALKPALYHSLPSMLAANEVRTQMNNAAVMESGQEPKHSDHLDVPRKAESPETDQYQTISRRNIFGLTVPTGSAPAKLPENAVPPTQDLVVNGVFSVGLIRCAMFTVTESGRHNADFTLCEGEQNEWLEVRAVENGTVKVVLKKPVMQIRNVGVEVILAVEPLKPK